MVMILAVLGFVVFLPLSVLVFLLVFFAWDVLTPKLIYRTLGRDLRAIFRFLRFKFAIQKLYWENASFGKLFQEQVKRNPNKNCLLFEDQIWTFQQVEDYSNQVANAFTAAGYQKKDEVALFMENRPEYICIWLGLSKIGVISALINTNLKLESLAHSINVINPKSIIFNADLAPAVKDVFPYLNKKSDVDYLCLDKMNNDSANPVQVNSLNSFIQDASKSPPDETKQVINFTDIVFYIYTSGTTGLPKAAIIRHSRIVYFGAAPKYIFAVKEDDIVYNSLPLYHSSGGILLVASVMVFGGTMALRKKFSASNFWKDAIKHKATVGQYIGEICRYLMNQPESPEESQHTIRTLIGNGLRPQIWEEFQNRFNIPQILEFYGATEGNASLINMFGKPKAVGFMARLFPFVYTANLIKMDPESCEPVRNESGLCILCKPGEPGVMVGKITYSSPITFFDGYASKSATRKKIIQNCFQKGDEAFYTGDIMVMDEDGYISFVDRAGDTFRWKGENVSTTEVEGFVSKALDFVSCIVYGVEIPGTEGKAGMAAIETESDIVLDDLHKKLTSSLPAYAIPIFIRICKQIEVTGTYKTRKVNLRKEGFNPAGTSDPIFILDAKARSYVKLNEESYKRIITGEMRL